MAWLKLNVFQKVARHWDSLHAYNAAQMMTLSGRPDRQRLADAWRETIAELGLGRVHIDGNRYRWEPADGNGDRIELIGTDPSLSVDRLMSHQLNCTFDESNEMPFRAFVVEQPHSYFAGVVYHHWIADSFSIRVLLREWFMRVFDPGRARRRPLRMADRGYWRLFGPERAGWRLGEAAIKMVRWSARCRWTRRVDPQGQKNLSTHFSLHRAPDGLVESLILSARRHGVTVNDLFMAAMARVCDRLVPVKRTPRRPDLSLGSVVDLRRRRRALADDTFGLFLGFTGVFVRPKELADDRLLLRCISRQNARVKQSREAESSMLHMVAGLVMARLFSTEGLMEYYRKRAATAAGISNVNLNRDWPGTYHPMPLQEYIRVSPVGPLVPVVFTPTTLGRQLNFGLTCRESVIAQEHAPALADLFLRQLQQFADR
jgi:hypothetical protein